jgi:ArsR family transcriptional regulator
LADLDVLSRIFRVLGDGTRMKIYDFLRADACLHSEEGATVGEIQYHVLGPDGSPSSLSFHLRELREAGLILMERRNRHIHCFVNPAVEQLVTRYFHEAPTSWDL